MFSTPSRQKNVLHRNDLGALENLVDELQRELVMAGGYRCVRREDALSPDGLHVGIGNNLSAGLPRLLVEERDRQETGMPLVHVENVDVAVSKCS
jgi:hypothetical protein